MVIRREDSGVSSLKNLQAWRWPPRRSVAVPTIESMWTDSVIFQRGSNEGILGMADRIPRKVQGKTPVGDPGYFVPQKLKQNVTLLYTFILTFSE